jgi:hypothetical protein
MTQIRRVVTGHDKNGKAIVLSDGPVPTVHKNVKMLYVLIDGDFTPELEGKFPKG